MTLYVAELYDYSNFNRPYLLDKMTIEWSGKEDRESIAEAFHQKAKAQFGDNLVYMRISKR